MQQMAKENECSPFSTEQRKKQFKVDGNDSVTTRLCLLNANINTYCSFIVSCPHQSVEYETWQAIH